MYFSVVLLVTFRYIKTGLPIQFCTDGSALNLRSLQSQTKVQTQIIRELLFADHCALLAHSEADAQELLNCFCGTAHRFGLTVSLRKMEMMIQPADRQCYSAAKVMAGSVELKVVNKFCSVHQCQHRRCHQCQAWVGQCCIWTYHTLQHGTAFLGEPNRPTGCKEALARLDHHLHSAGLSTYSQMYQSRIRLFTHSKTHRS